MSIPIIIVLIIMILVLMASLWKSILADVFILPQQLLLVVLILALLRLLTLPV